MSNITNVKMKAIELNNTFTFFKNIFMHKSKMTESKASIAACDLALKKAHTVKRLKKGEKVDFIEVINAGVDYLIDIALTDDLRLSQEELNNFQDLLIKAREILIEERN